MKNKFLRITLILIFSLFFFKTVFADEFIFNVSELQVTDQGNIYNGINKGKITTATGVEITSDNFEYLKKINQLQAFGNAQLYDPTDDVTINAEQIFYLKDKEIIYTVGETFIKVSNTYDIKGSDIKFLKKKMILSSAKKGTIKDDTGTVYHLDEFEYSITPEILQGRKIHVITNYQKIDSDNYFFESGIFNFKEKTFSAKDTSLRFHRTLFDDYNNDPRLKSVTSHGDDNKTHFEKGIFTSCRDNGKCPPWKIKAEKITHDKIKRQINYTDAWVSIYDVPVVYFPKFFHPDPSVKRQSGFLKPASVRSKINGNSIYTPYFYVISESKDMTLKPRYFRRNKFILQNEYRQKTEKSLTIADFSFAQGHDTDSALDLGDSRSHFFMNTKVELGFEDYEKSSLEIRYEKVSSDNYHRTFPMISPLFGSVNTLTSKINMILDHDDYNFTGSFEMYETLKGLNSDRYQYVLPSYSYSKTFEPGNELPENFLGSISFTQSGNNTLNQTNDFSTGITNDLTFSSFDKYTDLGIKTYYEAFIKNANVRGNENSTYKSTFESNVTTSYGYNTSLPLIKTSEKYSTRLEPKMNFRFSPHHMLDEKKSGRGITVNNIYNNNRLSLANAFESGESLTVGFDYKKEKIVTKIPTLHLGEIKKIEDFIDFKLASVVRIDEEDRMPHSSTLNKKMSNLFGQLKYFPSDVLEMNYTFSLKNDFASLEYNEIMGIFDFNKFSAELSFIDAREPMGSSNVVNLQTEFNFDEYNTLKFATRRNRDINLTEFYDLVYEYKNDCLIANVDYRKKYYAGNGTVPLEELFFSITIIPLTTFSPDKMILNKNRED